MGKEGRGPKGTTDSYLSGRWGGLKNYSHSVFPLEAKPGY